MLFRCIHSGQVYKFEVDHDVKQMLKHPEYRPVEEQVKQEPVKQPEVKPQRKAKEVK